MKPTTTTMLRACGIFLFMGITNLLYCKIVTFGFQFKNDLKQTIIPFKVIDNLIVIRAKVNDQYFSNLILDTGVRSIILFGKKTIKNGNDQFSRKIQINGLGQEKPPAGILTIGNKIEIKDVIGKSVGVVLMEKGHVLPKKLSKQIDGIIGYQLFSRFVVEINYKTSELILSEPYEHLPKNNSIQIPLTISMAKPYIYGQLGKRKKQKFLIDTGSSLNVLLFNSNNRNSNQLIGIGLNGNIYGSTASYSALTLERNKFKSQKVFSINKNERTEDRTVDGSLGSGFLSQFESVTIDYMNGKLYLLPKVSHLFYR